MINQDAVVEVLLVRFNLISDFLRIKETCIKLTISTVYFLLCRFPKDYFGFLFQLRLQMCV